jgi:proteasome lid subunit RPN8/RPN11
MKQPYMITHTLWPRAVDRTEIVCGWHFHPDAMTEPSFDWARALPFTYLVHDRWKPSRLVTRRWVEAIAVPVVRRVRHDTMQRTVRGFSPRPGREGQIRS